tara:strand:+ start:4917 stop:5159 length:243 start_codon:yes stop_codon:yes gene_type:complete
MIYHLIGQQCSVMKQFVLITGLFNSIIRACPYCAASDTIGGGLSVYIPLVGIILSPMVMVLGAILYIRKKEPNNSFEENK